MDNNPAALREEGIRILINGLGAVRAVEFLQQFQGGSGNYTEDREALLANETIDSITERIRRRKTNDSQ